MLIKEFLNAQDKAIVNGVEYPATSFHKVYDIIYLHIVVSIDVGYKTELIGGLEHISGKEWTYIPAEDIVKVVVRSTEAGECFWEISIKGGR